MTSPGQSLWLCQYRVASEAAATSHNLPIFATRSGPHWGREEALPAKIQPASVPTLVLAAVLAQTGELAAAKTPPPRPTRPSGSGAKRRAERSRPGHTRDPAPEPPLIGPELPTDTVPVEIVLRELMEHVRTRLRRLLDPATVMVVAVGRMPEDARPVDGWRSHGRTSDLSATERCPSRSNAGSAGASVTRLRQRGDIDAD